MVSRITQVQVTFNFDQFNMKFGAAIFNTTHADYNSLFNTVTRIV